MNPDKIKESIQAVVDGLTPLAQKLQVPIEHLWGWAMKHTYAVAISELLGFFLFGSLYAWIATILLRKGKEEGDLELASAFLFFAGVPIAILTAFVFMQAIPRLISPEWYTAQDIAGLLTGKN